MRHKVGYNRLSKKTSHRKAMLRNMVTSLFNYERITTTKAKAQEVRRKAEKMITRAKEDSVHNRREVARVLYSKATVAKLFADIAPRFLKRPGGYTRILKIGYRKGDAAELVILELVERKEKSEKDKKAKKTAKAAPAADKKQSAETQAKPAAKKTESKPALEKPVAKEAVSDEKKAEKKEVKPAVKKTEKKETKPAEKKTEKKPEKKAEKKAEKKPEKKAAVEPEKTKAAEPEKPKASGETGVVETSQQTIIEGE